MPVLSDRRYTETHEWCRIEPDDQMTVGITQFAADQLTDITFVELPKVGTRVKAGQPFGTIESVKSAGDLVAPVSGDVVAINDGLARDPGTINRDPFGQGWMIRMKPSHPEEYDKLLDATAYEAATAH